MTFATDAPLTPCDRTLRYVYPPHGLSSGRAQLARRAPRVPKTRHSIVQPKWVQRRVREAVAPISYNVELPSSEERCRFDRLLLPGKGDKRHSVSRTSLEG
ncbi:hypothetical protein EVAR_95585_1 [Eumeta japonica]|uniref:Uncharacterized protein n=1 Tax=Eumeta variegata TaxID=151549 RepID=A0A4C1VJ11_EUMVA|nr:hypothetical protein EVAR_95585_1 [Eumeta japonica]